MGATRTGRFAYLQAAGTSSGRISPPDSDLIPGGAAMTRRVLFVLAALFMAGSLALVPFSSIARADSSTWWFHIKVLDKTKDGDTVRVNLSASMVQAALPILDTKHLCSGRVRVDHRDLTDADLRALLAATRDAQDGKYVTVTGRDEQVLVSKKNGEMLIQVEESGDHPEHVTIRLPIEVLDALLSGPADELNLQAGVQALLAKGKGDFVSVEDDDATVHIWIDDRDSTD